MKIVRIAILICCFGLKIEQPLAQAESPRSKVSFSIKKMLNLVEEPSITARQQVIEFRFDGDVCLVLVLEEGEPKSFDPQFTDKAIRASLLLNVPEFDDASIILFFHQTEEEQSLIDAVRIGGQNDGAARYLEKETFLRLVKTYGS